MARKGGKRINAGRKPIPEEREFREQLKQFFPQVVAFWKEVMTGDNMAMKERVAGRITDKLIADAKPDESEMLERLEKLEEAVARL